MNVLCVEDRGVFYGEGWYMRTHGVADPVPESLPEGT